MKVLVTGHSGLIGSHLVDRLLAKGHEVIGVSRTNKNANPQCRNVELDLRDTARTAALIEEVAPELVYHLAANAAEGKGQFSPIDMATNGYLTFFNVITPAIRTGKLKRFVYTSSIAAYGAIDPRFLETDQPKPQDIYGISKYANELSLKVLSAVHDFEYVIARPHNVTGPRQNMSDPYRNVVTLFMNHLLKGIPYKIFGDGSMERCFSYVKDVVDVLYKCGVQENTAGMTFNVGSDKAYSIQELSDTIQEITGINIPPIYVPERVQEVHTAIADHTLQNTVLGYQDTPFKQALQETWDWVRQQGPQEYKFDPLEIPNDKAPKHWRI